MIVALCLIIVLVGFVAFGQRSINSRVDMLNEKLNEEARRVDRLDDKVGDMKEEQKAISEGYMRLYQDVSTMIKESFIPLSNKLEKIDDYIREGK